MIEVEVTRAADVAIGVRGFSLASPDGAALPKFEPGAHVDVEIRPGLVRQYSLCGPADAPHYEIAVLREPASRGGSATLVETIAPGDRLRIGSPRNLFPLRPGHGPVRLIAGGIGVTPIVSMAHALVLQGRPFQFWYAGRNRASMAFADAIANAFPDQARLHCDDEAGGALDLSIILATRLTDEELYVCGPAGLIAAAVGAASDAGWPAASVHRESFVAAAPTGDDLPFMVRLARSDRTFLVPGDRTALDVLLEAGVDLDSSCEQGVCGTCMVKVLAGRPDHRDLFLSDEERATNDCFTPCCSRALTLELVLDL